MSTILLTVLLDLFSLAGHPAKEASIELVYEATIGSRVIGELSAFRNSYSDSVVFLVTSDIDANVGFPLSQDYLLRSVYQDGILERSELRNVVNDKVRAHTIIHRENNRYIAIKSEPSVLDTPPVHYSIAHLFFYEPQGMARVFSENYAEYLKCSPAESDWYEKYCLDLPDRNRIFWYYSDGICERFDVRLVVFNVKYELKQVKLLP
jgi:hypothetical protein